MLLLNKPSEVTSNGVLQQVRRHLNAAKGGHGGALDPFATGMLPLAFGEATKFLGRLLEGRKCYTCRVQLGLTTDTGDRDGEVVKRMAVPDVNSLDLESCLDGFRGDIEQIPPMYSALKRDGKRLYELARAGETVDRPPRPVTIHRLELAGHGTDWIDIVVECSKGTYIRTLAEDLAESMGTCGHAASLHRDWVAPFSDQSMVDLDDFLSLDSPVDVLLPVDSALSTVPLMPLDAAQTDQILHGQPIALDDATDGEYRLSGPNQRFLGLGELKDGVLRSTRLCSTTST